METVIKQAGFVPEIKGHIPGVEPAVYQFYLLFKLGPRSDVIWRDRWAGYNVGAKDELLGKIATGVDSIHN